MISKLMKYRNIFTNKEYHQDSIVDHLEILESSIVNLEQKISQLEELVDSYKTVT